MEVMCVIGEPSINPIMSHFSVYAQDADGVGSNFGIMSNPAVAGDGGSIYDGASLLVVLAVIKGVGAGNTTCTMKIGEANSTVGMNYLHEVTLEVGFQALVDDVRTKLFDYEQVQTKTSLRLLADWHGYILHGSH